MKQNLPKWYMIKMREANRFKEYERIPKNRIGGDYWNTYWTIRYMLRL